MILQGLGEILIADAPIRRRWRGTASVLRWLEGGQGMQLRELGAILARRAGLIAATLIVPLRVGPAPHIFSSPPCYSLVFEAGYSRVFETGSLWHPPRRAAILVATTPRRCQREFLSFAWYTEQELRGRRARPFRRGGRSVALRGKRHPQNQLLPTWARQVDCGAEGWGARPSLP